MIPRERAVECSPEHTVAQVAMMMKTKRVGSVVVALNDKPVGIVTQTDMVNKVIVDGLSVNKPVKDIMTTSLITLSSNGSKNDVIETLKKYHIHHLVVVDPQTHAYVGICSTWDFARDALAEGKPWEYTDDWKKEISYS
jgi:CBS domain-containing protein